MLCPNSGDDITALLLAPVGGCKISYKTMQVEQTATLLHALKCKLHTSSYGCQLQAVGLHGMFYAYIDAHYINITNRLLKFQVKHLHSI